MRNIAGTFLVIAVVLLSSCKDDPIVRLVLLPDTQSYAESYPEIFYAQTEWIAEHSAEIAFVLHQGDITDDNNEKQWKVAEEALGKLDGKVNYALAAGNHDMGTGGSADIRDTGLFNRFFPYNKYSKQPAFGGAFEPGKMDNVYFLFRAGGIKWLVLSLEFGPRNQVLDWAAKVIREHPDHRVIINTHAYLYSDDTRMSEARGHKWLPQYYGVGKDTGQNAVNNGEQIWKKLAGKYENVLLVFSGHVLNDGTGRLVSTGEQGNEVYQMLANYQRGVESSVNGGNGYLRIIGINTRDSLISVRTYSPLSG